MRWIAMGWLHLGNIESYRPIVETLAEAGDEHALMQDIADEISFQLDPSQDALYYVIYEHDDSPQNYYWFYLPSEGITAWQYPFITRMTRVHWSSDPNVYAGLELTKVLGTEFLNNNL